MSRRLVCTLALLAGLALPATAAADYSSTPSAGLIADGPVHAIAAGSDGRVYLGGAFGAIGPSTGAGVGFDPTLATRDTSLPQVYGGDGTFQFPSGTILVAISDGAGGYYIGGTFGYVGGVVRHNLAHILADNTVDPHFDPEPDGPVQYLALSGPTLYVTGVFANIAGVARNGAAALSTADGSATAFDAQEDYNDTQCGIAVYGAHVFVCDYFASSIGGQTRPGLAELDLSGNATAWNPPHPYGNPQPTAIYVSPAGVLYAGGNMDWSAQDGQPAHNDNLNAWQIPADPNGVPSELPLAVDFQNLRGCCSYPTSVSSMLQLGNTLYVAGAFTDVYPVSGQDDPRGDAVAFDVSNPAAATPTVLPWDPQANSTVQSVASVDSELVLGGSFSQLGSTPRGHLAAVDPTTAAPVGSDPAVDGAVNAVAIDGSHIYAAGGFVTAQATPRRNLAVLNPDGTLSSVAPAVDGEVDALAISGTTLYAGGQFRNATGQGDSSSSTRSYLAAFNSSDGSLLPFDPEPDGGVAALATDTDSLYVGGGFSHLGGTAHGGLAAFSLADGSLRSFDPAPTGTTTALAVSAGRLYAGGTFGTLSGESGSPARSHVAAFDLPSLALDPFTPPALDGDVSAVAASPGAVYVGGAFDHAGSIYQPRLVALDPGTGALTSWNPQLGDSVDALSLQGSTLYAGGAFTVAGGGHRLGVTGLDTTTGAATSFAPSPDRDVDAIAVTPSQLLIGGPFQLVGSSLQPNLASFSASGGENGAGGGGTGGGGAGESSGPPSGAAGLTAGPDTIITGGPDAFTSARQVSFTFTSDTPGAHFQCRLDGGDFAACSSPYTTPSALALGSHTFVVRAVDPAGVVDIGGAAESFAVVPPGATLAGTAPGAPRLGNVSVRRQIIRGASLRGRRAPGFRFRVSQPSTVIIAFVHRICRARRCRWVDAGALAPVRESAGAHFVAFSGGVAGGELIAGSYRARIVAVNATGTSSRPALANFSLISRHVHGRRHKTAGRHKPVHRRSRRHS